MTSSADTHSRGFQFEDNMPDRRNESHRSLSFYRAKGRQRVLALVADIEAAIIATEEMLADPLEDEILKTASEQLPQLRQAWQQLHDILNQPQGEQ